MSRVFFCLAAIHRDERRIPVIYSGFLSEVAEHGRCPWRHFLKPKRGGAVLLRVSVSCRSRIQGLRTQGACVQSAVFDP